VIGLLVETSEFNAGDMGARPAEEFV